MKNIKEYIKVFYSNNKKAVIAFAIGLVIGLVL